MMDRMTGKTLSDCYIEFPSQSEAIRAAEYGNQRTLKNRVLSATLCSHQQFLDITFPRRKKSISTDPDSPWFITREEINSLLTICKNYKVNNKKFANRYTFYIHFFFSCIASFFKKMCWKTVWKYNHNHYKVPMGPCEYRTTR